MRNVVSISLPDKLLKKVRVQTKRENSTSSELVRKALNDYFFKTEFGRLRNKAMIELAKKKIVLTEEKIFKQIS